MLIAAALAWLWNHNTAWSLLLGGGVYLLPQSWFAWQAFRYQGARLAPRAVQAFYQGEAGKYLLTGALFAVIFATVKPLDVAALFGAFVGMTVANIVLLGVGSSRQK